MDFINQLGLPVGALNRYKNIYAQILLKPKQKLPLGFHQIENKVATANRYGLMLPYYGAWHDNFVRQSKTTKHDWGRWLVAQIQKPNGLTAHQALVIYIVQIAYLDRLEYGLDYAFTEYQKSIISLLPKNPN